MARLQVQKLFVQTVEGFKRRFVIDIRTEQEVIAVHPMDAKIGGSEEPHAQGYRETYDKLVLSPGARTV